ncbi:hypothetical protein POAN111098_03175 [Polynucleobacter antarcticus]
MTILIKKPTDKVGSVKLTSKLNFNTEASVLKVFALFFSKEPKEKSL